MTTLTQEQVQSLTDIILSTLKDPHPDYIKEWKTKIKSCGSKLELILQKVFPSDRYFVLNQFVKKYPELAKSLGLDDFICYHEFRLRYPDTDYKHVVYFLGSGQLISNPIPSENRFIPGSQTAVEKVKALIIDNLPITTGRNPPLFWLDTDDNDLFLELCTELNIDPTTTVISEEFGYSKVELMFYDDSIVSSINDQACGIKIITLIHNSKLNISSV